jgi:hypothetical protein
MSEAHKGVDLDVALSLPEAAHRYGLSLRTLAQRVRTGEIPAYKVRGLRGREWRVLPGELERCGYTSRAKPPDNAASAELGALQQHVRMLEGQLAAERRRSATLDQRLGAALLECGRLRAQAAAGAARNSDGHEAGRVVVPSQLVMHTEAETGRTVSRTADDESRRLFAPSADAAV